MDVDGSSRVAVVFSRAATWAVVAAGPHADKTIFRHLDGPVDERGTYQFQSDTAAFHLDVFASKPWLSGAIYWLLQDFAAVPGWGGGDPRPDPPFVQKGLVDLTGHLKPAFAVVSAIYHATKQFAPLAK